MVERTNSSGTTLIRSWCGVTEREGRVIDFFWVALCEVVNRGWEADPRRLDGLALGKPTSPPTMTYLRSL